MGDKLLDPLEVNKDPQLIKDAQAEIGKLDVLVCGECHSIFHYIEQFQEHKLLGKCPRESPILESCINEQKPQVWAFMLWKNAKFKNSQKADGGPSSWSVYQLWCNLENSQKEAWVAAGRNIQSFTRLSTAKVQEVKAKVQPIQVKHSVKNSSQQSQMKSTTAGEMSKEEEEAEDDPLEEGEIRLSSLTDAQRRALKAQGEPATLKTDVDPLADSDSELDTEDEVEREAALAKMRQEKKENKQKNIMKKSILKPVQLNSDVTILPSMKKNGTSKKALRTIENDKKEEHTVEKIISRRYNPGKKTFEYLLKWENCEEEQNTWEPAAHLESCKYLLDQFELNLKKQKAQKVTQKSMMEKKGENALKNIERQASIDSVKEASLTPGGRPQRTSKQKALNQVKAWCGSISDADEGSGKRSFSDSDSDSVEKKIKLEPESSDSEEETRTTVRKLKATSLNGVGKKQPLPDNVLVPDAQGIVRINQKQLPALSSGVYVMSKTAGIIKLDSDTSKIATSGGHAVIKVAPKIGQTSIKVIKKEAITNGSKQGGPGKVKIPPRMYSPKIIKKTPPPTLIKKPEPVPPPLKDDDDSDGLPELEFPTDLPLPSPDSPPGEFTLCPLTGKIIGQDYPEEEETKVEESAEDNVNNTLENIVKLAAADILQDKDSSEAVGPTLTTPEITAPKEEPSNMDIMDTIQATPTSSEPMPPPTEPPESIPMEIDTPVVLSEPKPEPQIEHRIPTPPETSTSTILSTALSNADIEPTIEPPIIMSKRQIISTPNIRQKTEMTRNIINRTIVPKPAPQAIITRITPGPNARNKPFMQKQMMNPMSMHSTSQLRKPVKHSYTNRNAIRKIGSTSVYQTIDSAAESSKTLIKTTTKPTIAPAPATNTVINMPLLSEPEPEPPIEEPPQEEAVPTETGELNTISLSENEAPLLITGEDGTIYQVAGQNEEGQTILITQDADGQQQCLLVAPENAAELSQAVAAAPVVDTPQIDGPLVINAEQEAEAEADNSEDSQVVAQIVSAQPPSPGGTRKVVLMLPDGNLMMTEVTAEQYAALELDK